MTNVSRNVKLVTSLLFLSGSCCRLEFSWDKRGEDFERWKAPPTFLGPAPPTTIHLAGESRRRELQQWLDREHLKWCDRLVVKDTIFHTHRYIE